MDVAIAIVFVLWIVLSVAIAVAASNRGHNGAGWFFLSLLISPVIALLFLIASRDRRLEVTIRQAGKDEEGPTKVCPRCAERVKRAAKVCRFCGNEFSIEPPVLQRAPSTCLIDPFELARRSQSDLSAQLSRLTKDQIVRIGAECGMDERGYMKGWSREDAMRHIVQEAVKVVRDESN
jgi:hypothetical protein